MLNLLFQLPGLLPIHKSSVCHYLYLLIGPTKERKDCCVSHCPSPEYTGKFPRIYAIQNQTTTSKYLPRKRCIQLFKGRHTKVMRNQSKLWIRYDFKLHYPHANTISQPCVDGLALPKTLGLKTKQTQKKPKQASKQTNTHIPTYSPKPHKKKKKSKKEGGIKPHQLNKRHRGGVFKHTKRAQECKSVRCMLLSPSTALEDFQPQE